MAAPVRIGTCSFADEALAKHRYPPGTPVREWVPPLRELSNESDEAYAFFNDNQTDGVAQAPTA